MDDNIESYNIPISDLAVTTNVDDLTCIICLNICAKPVMVKCCERLICSNCIKSVLKYSYKCPYCNNVNVSFERPPKIISRLFESLTFKCIRSDCSEKIKYYFYFDHIYNTCKFKNNNLLFCKQCEIIAGNNHVCNNNNISPIDNSVSNLYKGEPNILK